MSCGRPGVILSTCRKLGHTAIDTRVELRDVEPDPVRRTETICTALAANIKRRRARRPRRLERGVERVEGDFKLILSGGPVLLGPEQVANLLAEQPAITVGEQQAKQL